MIPEDAVFWIAAMDQAPAEDPNLLCGRHADAMIVPRGWTLDDRREDTLRLFRPADADVEVDATPSSIRRPRRAAPDPDHTPVQLVIDGTGEIDRPDLTAIDDQVDEPADPEAQVDSVEPVAPWQPDFDQEDDLDGLLSVTSPLLARAFRGTDRPG